MNKSYTNKLILDKQLQNYQSFINYINNEGFTQTIDKVGNFAINMPLFYKKVSNNIFLIFNTPTYNHNNSLGYHIDFWKVISKTKYGFLKRKLLDNEIITIKLNFDIANDIHLYQSLLTF